MIILLKNLTIIVTGIKPNGKCPLKMEIKDSNNCVVYHSCNTNIKKQVCLCPKNVYHISAEFCGQKLTKTIYFNSQNTIYIPFNTYCRNIRRVITLRDFNYNLPIEKGLILFGKNS